MWTVFLPHAKEEVGFPQPQDEVAYEINSFRNERNTFNKSWSETYKGDTEFANTTKFWEDEANRPKNRFPLHHHTFAKECLPCRGSSANVEGIFSGAGQLVKGVPSYNASTIEDYMMLHSNTEEWGNDDAFNAENIRTLYIKIKSGDDPQTVTLEDNGACNMAMEDLFHSFNDSGDEDELPLYLRILCLCHKK